MSEPPAASEVERHLLVTGATGFIGGRLVRRALDAGDRVRVLVRQDGPVPDELAGAEAFRGDLLEPASLEGIETDITHVVHGAGILGKWGMDDSVLRAVNEDGPLHLLRRFADSGVTRFVHLSAGGVTGPVPTRAGAVDETYDCRPATAYEQTKLRGEQGVLATGAELGIPALVLRPTFTYGPGDPHKVALFRAVKKGRFAFIDNGGSVVHPVFIEDLLDGIMLGLDRGVPGEVYIVGGPAPVTKRELVCTIADAIGARHPWIRIPRWIATPVATVMEAVGRRVGVEPILTRSRVMMMGDNFGYRIDKARRALGYEPRTDLRTGIDLAVKAYREAGLL